MAIQPFLELIFWGSFLVLSFTFAGYPLLIELLSRTKTANHPQDPATWPPVTVVLATHNEENRIVDRITNLLDSDYERDKINIVIVDDASTDRTIARLKGLHEDNLTVVENSKRRGKAACLNEGMRVVATEFVVFADARQRFAKDAIKRLVARCVPNPG